MRLEGGQGVFFPLREEERMELVHETVVQRRKIFKAIRACFLKAFKKEHLATRVQLLKKLAELSHGIAA
jgi:hypothetical protein